LGCDTTSRVLDLGKGLALKNLQSNPYFGIEAEAYHKINNTKEAIMVAGNNALVLLYGGKPSDTLDGLRLVKFCQKVGSTTTPVQPQSLPPTSAAAYHHYLRVYHRVQEWKGHGLKANDWGWKLENSVFIPSMTDKDMAPKNLLEVIRCNCKSGCLSMRCSCRKSGMDCTLACGECCGVCSNMSPLDDIEYDDNTDNA